VTRIRQRGARRARKASASDQLLVRGQWHVMIVAEKLE
jgi:hypothetical protein